MNIEVATISGAPPKTKGDLFENLSRDLLEASGYEVVEEIRITGAELDLLCKHSVSEKVIYVECKAHKDKIPAATLRQLLGTVAGYDYFEGWLISTSEFSKDEKGFEDMWKRKPADEAGKLSFYTPSRIVRSLENASLIVEPPTSEAVKIAGGSEFLGNWTLLISSYGICWAVYTLRAGAPYGVLIFNAKNGRHIEDAPTLDNISKLDCTLAEYNLSIGIAESNELETSKSGKLPQVVEVQTGDSWDDYRPARPQDFVGREHSQKEILSFLSSIRDNESDTRIFAITGNSGLGKSSLVAKVRDRSRNKFHKNRYYTFAVDIRGAKTQSYISAALLTCLKDAQKNGFGSSIELQLTDPSSPLSSQTISEYLTSLEEKQQVICLIFDQFEELYSKPELFSVFAASKDLMLDVAANKSNLALGFAWKTDSTTQQDHPAYHMWYELSDYRKVYKLDVFDTGEISKALTTFEKEVGFKLPAELRHQLDHSCQGFPWLLKKLCINLHESNKKGAETETVLADLDVRGLFEGDLETLTQQELACLKLVARNAPADWSEIIEISGISVLNGLVKKRLVVKSGDRLNVYWDIFRDYLLTGNVPIVPFNYIPTSDVSSMLKVFSVLDKDKYLESSVIAEKTQHNEKTVWNIGADLVMLGLAERNGVAFRHRRGTQNPNEDMLLQGLREKMSKHALKVLLYKNRPGQQVSQKYIVECLKNCLPKASYNDNTWSVYSNRLIRILMSTGHLVNVGGKYVVQDTGSPILDKAKIGNKGKQKGVVFTAAASPASVCEALSIVSKSGELEKLISKGYRNSLTVLKRFELVSVHENSVVLNTGAVDKFGGHDEAVWTSAKNEPVIGLCIEILQDRPKISTNELGELVSKQYQLSWTASSASRNGSGLKQWSLWIRNGIANSNIPEPPGREKPQSTSSLTRSLQFED